DADHILAWANGGTTGISNLGQPCPKHHKLRHTTGWKPTPATKNEPPGWTSPSGRHYPSEHQDWEPPQWPAGFLERARSRPEKLSLQGEPQLPEKYSLPERRRLPEELGFSKEPALLEQRSLLEEALHQYLVS
ncbi:HNH endonuclease signature motif containing protein, partial [Arthrobacter sp. SAFR-044]|uniref:HNH endonuclease signature motif containing protein n=1 Tax=Arthrobacter sp. SAFR-044 TaxID=3387278 RepID=UPI003F7BE77E